MSNRRKIASKRRLRQRANRKTRKLDIESGDIMAMRIGCDMMHRVLLQSNPGGSDRTRSMFDRHWLGDAHIGMGTEQLALYAHGAGLDSYAICDYAFSGGDLVHDVDPHHEVSPERLRIIAETLDSFARTVVKAKP